MADRFRIGALQYYIRPIQAFDQFAEQVRALAETAHDYRCRMLVYPEYFSTQLLTLGDVRRPIREQIDDLAAQEERIHELLIEVARTYQLYIVGGSMPARGAAGVLHNRCWVVSPRGESVSQDKLHMTRFEDEHWGITEGDTLKVIDSELGKFAVAICYDVEFPEIAHVAASQGARFLVTPSCTDDRQGFLRVRFCAHARAIENQMYVIHAGTVGSLPMVPAVSLNYGQAAILNPCDYAFSRDGVLAEGVPNQESMVIGDINLDLITEARLTGTVLPLRDSQRKQDLLKQTEMVSL